MSARSAEWDETYGKLGCAIMMKDLSAPEMIRRKVESGFPVNYSQLYSNWTLLHQAAAYNRPDCCRTLFELGVNPNMRALGGRTAFYVACYHEFIDCAKDFIDAGADWMIPHEDGTLPLDLIEDTNKRAELEVYIKAHLEKQKAARMDVEITPPTEIEICW